MDTQRKLLVALLASLCLAAAGCSADGGSSERTGGVIGGPAPDGDNDGIPDAEDNCPALANADSQSDDVDGDGIGDACDDSDGDNVVDADDNCVAAFNPSQSNADGDSLGDACDLDADNDGLSNNTDPCPLNPDLSCGSEPDPDSDGDGHTDSQDNCPAVANPGQEDSAEVNAGGAADGVGDACDNSDSDAWLDADDNCPLVDNQDQADLDADGIGDACDDEPGVDNDGDLVEDSVDNCPTTANPGQEDADVDGIGDACDGCDAVNNTDGEPLNDVQENVESLTRAIGGAVGEFSPDQLNQLIQQAGCLVNTAVEPVDTIANTIVQTLEAL
ncbi:MAG: thrombospondin type 3 repeat-containing protein, partial [Gammaproteobacteria bacterium]|nr:thrombospondin type 3 repeat-containing protein [Gammaproteobacteria bacterium]